MAEFNGTSGNDTVHNQGGGGSLVLVVSGSAAEGGELPRFNVLVNGAVVQSNIAVTANQTTGATQTVSVAVPSSITDIGIQYVNDGQSAESYAAGEDRNLYIKSIALNGVALDPSTAKYIALFGDGSSVEKPGQADMVWGGTLTFSGPTVVNAAASGGIGTNDTFNGLAGLDTVVYSGARAEYGIDMGAGGSFTVSHGAEVDTTVSVERLQFSNMKHALDMDGVSGFVAKLIATLWGENYLSVKEFAGVGINVADQGRTGLELAGFAVNTGEFGQRAGSFSNADFVKTVAANVGYAGDTSGFLADLNAGTMTKAQLAVIASDYMAANMASHLTLMGVMQTGIDYV